MARSQMFRIGVVAEQAVTGSRLEVVLQPGGLASKGRWLLIFTVNNYGSTNLELWDFHGGVVEESAVTLRESGLQGKRCVKIRRNALPSSSKVWRSSEPFKMEW